MHRGISSCIALALLVLLSSSSAHALLDEADAEQCDASGPRADCGEFPRYRKVACITGSTWSSPATAAVLPACVWMQPSSRRGSRPLPLPCSLHVWFAMPMLPCSELVVALPQAMSASADESARSAAAAGCP